MTVVFAIVVVLALINIICIVLNVRSQRAFERKRVEIENDPPFMKCPTCGLTVLGNDPVSQQVHILCILKTDEMIEADKAKAIESSTANEEGKYTIKITQKIEKSRPSSWMLWSYDDYANTYYRFHWTVTDPGGNLVDSGYDKDHDDASWTAETVVERHRDGNREYLH